MDGGWFGTLRKTCVTTGFSLEVCWRRGEDSVWEFRF